MKNVNGSILKENKMKLKSQDGVICLDLNEVFGRNVISTLTKSIDEKKKYICIYCGYHWSFTGKLLGNTFMLI